MAKVSTLQTSFNQGLLSPEMHGRTDLQQYYSGASVMDNVIVQPQGGFSKRPGFKKLVDIPTNNVNGDEFKVMHMTASNSESYFICMFPNGEGTVINKDTYESYPLPSNINSPIGLYIKDIQYVQSGGSLVYVHPLFPPMIIRRKITNDAISFEHVLYEFVSLPEESFDNTSENMPYLMDNLVMNFNGFENGDTFKLGLRIISQDKTLIDDTEFTFNKKTIPVTPNTTDGSIVGDDVTDMVNALKAGGETGYMYNFIAQYDEVNKRVWVEKSDGSVTSINVIDRTFTGIIAKEELPAASGVAILFCVSKSRADISLDMVPVPTVNIAPTPPPPVETNTQPTATIQKLKLAHGTLGDSGAITFQVILGNAVTPALKFTSTTGLDVFAQQLKNAIQDLNVTNKPKPTVDITYNTTGYDSYEFVIEFTGNALGKWPLMTVVNATGPITTAEFVMVVEGEDGNEVPELPKEPSFSNTRGWPATVITHGNRLVFGGSYSRPQTLYMSKLGITGEFNYVPEKDSEGNTLPPLATDPLSLTLSTKRNTPITGMQSGRRLLVFTASSTHSVQGNGDTVDTITASDANAVTVGTYGSKLVSPEELNGYVYYLQASGSSLNSTNYEFSRDTYQVTQTALFSSHVLVNPKDLTVVTGSTKFNTTYLCVLNGDGTLAYYSSLIEQGLQNWTRFTTDGSFIAAQGIDDKLFTLVRRGVSNSGYASVSIEVMEPDSAFCDGAQEVELAGGNILGNLGEYAGKEISIIADGYPVKLVVEEGKDYVKLPFATLNATYGLPINMLVTTMPLNVNLKSGSTINSRKRLSQAKITLLNSLGVTLEYEGREYTIADRPMDFVMDEPPTPITGVIVKSLLGWTKLAKLSIKSDDAVPVTVLSLETKVSIAE